jgi:predicted RNA-binding Zn ribbon-like protein
MQIDDPLVERLNLDETYLCIDFVDTVNWRTSDHPEERLRSYADLVAWAQRVALVGVEDAAGLLAQAEAQPSLAADVLCCAIDLREALYRILTVAGDGAVPLQPDLDLLNGELGAAMAHGELVLAAPGFALRWKHDPARLDGFLLPIARSAADLLTSGDLDRLGVCHGEPGCGWLFYDTSRNHSRRWCTMEFCGNRAKAKRHYKKGTKMKDEG